MYSSPLRFLPLVVRPTLQSQTRSLSTLRICRHVAVPLRRPLAARFLSDSAPAPSSEESSNSPVVSASTDAAAQKEEIGIESYAPTPVAPPQGLLYSLTQEDIDGYLKPMYTRQWVVKWNNKQLSPIRGTLFFAKSFKFSDYDATMSFLNDIASIVREENHHPEISFNHNIVKFQTQTHDIAGPSIPIPNKDDGKIPRILPGITLNDVRLAIRIEDLFTGVYLADTRGHLPVRSSGHTPRTLDEMKLVKPHIERKRGKGSRPAEQKKTSDAESASDSE